MTPAPRRRVSTGEMRRTTEVERSASAYMCKHFGGCGASTAERSSSGAPTAGEPPLLQSPPAWWCTVGASSQPERTTGDGLASPSIRPAAYGSATGPRSGTGRMPALRHWTLGADDPLSTRLVRGRGRSPDCPASACSKYAAVRRSPSTRGTSGRQPSRSLANVRSGRRWVGSSTGSGSNRISDAEPVTSRTSRARSSTGYSSELPMFTGCSTSLSNNPMRPRIVSSTQQKLRV
jgi:hypothetical protein